MKAPAFQFYPADFIMGTAEMTAEEVGGYIRALCHQWTKEGLPNNRKKLESMLGINGESLDTILEKFTLYPDGRLKNDRLEKIRAEQMEYRAKQAENGKKGGNPAFKKGQSNPYYNPKDNQPVMSKDNPADNPPHNPKINPSSSPSSSSSSSLSSSISLGGSFEKEPNAPPKSENQISPLFPEALTAEPKKPKEKSSAKKEKVQNHLFRDSPFYDLEKFIQEFPESEYGHIDLGFYYWAVHDWSEGKGERRINWIATARGFMRKDDAEGKLKTKNLPTHGQPSNSYGQKQQPLNSPSGAELAYLIASRQG